MDFGIFFQGYILKLFLIDEILEGLLRGGVVWFGRKRDECVLIYTYNISGLSNYKFLISSRDFSFSFNSTSIISYPKIRIEIFFTDNKFSTA